jgi:Cu(I)/Ag(I) efflux system membrane fusion protein
MKKLLRIGLLVLVILIAAYSLYQFTGNKTEAVIDAHVHSYACPMQCEGEKVYARPGSCPVCNMDLVRLDLPEKDKDASADPLVEPTDSFVAGEFKTLTAQDTVLISELTLPGIVTFNPDASVNIAARVSGRIEKLYVNYKYQKVSKGQKIFDVYSPELLTEQQNYIYLISNDPGNTSLIQSAKQKLMLYGMSGGQIRALSETKRTSPRIAVFSPAEGIITSTESMNAVGAAMNTGQGTEQLSVKQGDYVSKGETVFKLLDNNKVWAVFNISQEDQHHIKTGQTIRIFSELEKNDFIETKIDFVETQLDPDNKTNRLRVNLRNEKLKFPVGLRLTGMVQSSVPGLWIPQEALVDLGQKKIVFLKVEKGFKTKEISTGVKTDGFVQVIGGLTFSDSIARNAQYLTDSESFIKITEDEK